MSTLPIATPANPSPLPTGPAATRRISRDDIIALAKQGRHWEFVPLALRLLKQLPEDHAVRLLVATTYARLGLRSVTREQLDRLPAALQGDPSVVALRGALSSFPPDEIGVEARVSTCRANADALAARGIVVHLRCEEWASLTSEEQWYACRDGNIVRRAAGAGPDDLWVHFRDDRREADCFPFPHLATPGASIKPYAVEGVSPPWLLLRLWERTPPGADGYRPRISVVQTSEREALDGLACADLRRLIADDRVRFFLGDDAGHRFASDLAGRLGERAAGPAVVLATVRARAVPGVSESLQRFSAHQQEEHARLLARVDEVYAPRTLAWWRERYAAPTEPLRVLVPTCRYSTFVRHSAADLAEAFAAAGWSARVLVEPDDTSHLSSIAYLRELAEFRPDMIVLINYPRASIGSFIPPTVPYICWLQDAMPHQFDAGLARQQGPLDFLAGYLHREMFTEFGFSRERAATFPVAVSARKFHAGPVGDECGARLACEIAYVSHHSETPDAMHARLVAEAGAKEPLAARIFEELRGDVKDISLATMDRLPPLELRDAAERAARRVLGGPPPEGTVTLLFRQYCIPMCDRLIRHQTLAWAARLARREGWRLRIHGRGWEAHPTLQEHACGELSHDDELRASYRCARVHLHASSNWLMHQRVMECALSGGLPLSRLKKGDLVQWEQAALHALALEGQIIMERRTELKYREYGFSVADSAVAMEYVCQLQRLGLPAPWDLWVHGKRYDEFVSMPGEAAEPAAGWFLGDLSQSTFRTEDDLGRLVHRAVTDDSWRDGVSRVMRERIGGRYTTDAMVRGLRSLVERSLR